MGRRTAPIQTRCCRGCSLRDSAPTTESTQHELCISRASAVAWIPTSPDGVVSRHKPCVRTPGTESVRRPQIVDLTLNDQHEVVEGHGDGKQQRVEAVEDAAVPWNEKARVFHAQPALDRGFR